MKKNIKKILKVLGIFLLIILVALIAYLIYLFASYHRIPDNQALKIEKISDGTAAADTLTTEKEYSALTYNVGFGAYTPDFSAWSQPFRTCSFLQISGYGFSEKKLSDIDKLQQVL